MTDAQPSLSRTWRYRFTRPGDVEIEVREFSGDDPAVKHADELSKAQDTPVIVHRLRGTVDWEYVTEADARP